MNGPERAPAAEVRGLVKAYGAHPVLRGVDVVVPDGQVTALLGPSGCGKTTMLRALAGFDRPDAGEVVLGGVVVDAPGTFVPPRRRRVGYVPQEGALFTHLTVAGNIGFGVPRTTRRARTGEMLDLVGLRELADRRPDELSGGQQQRVALARALAVAPSLVLLDEPFSALDPGLRAQVQADVLALLRSTSTTVLLVTHDQEEALSIADLVAVMNRGMVLQIDTPERLHATPATAEVARFLGTGSLLPATRGPGAVAACALGDLPLHADAGAAASGTVLVRSDQVVLAPTHGLADRSAATGTVIARAFYGHDAVVRVVLDRPGAPGATRPGQAPPARTEIEARCAGGDDLPVGLRVNVAVRGPVVFLEGSTSDADDH